MRDYRKEAQERLELNNVYTGILGQLINLRAREGTNTGFTDAEITVLAKDTVATYIDDYNKVHPDNPIKMSEKDKQGIAKNLARTIKKLDRMISAEIDYLSAPASDKTVFSETDSLTTAPASDKAVSHEADYQAKGSFSLDDILTDPSILAEPFKLENLKRTEESQLQRTRESQKPRSGLASRLSSYFSRSETSVVDDLNKAILDMIGKATTQKGKNEEKSNAKATTPPTPKVQTKGKQPTKPAENYLTKSERRDINRTRAERVERMAKHVERLQQEPPPVVQKNTKQQKPKVQPHKAVEALAEKSKTSHTKKSKFKTFVSSLLSRNKPNSGRGY